LPSNHNSDILKRVISMARFARKKSKTGIYHIMLRGIDRRDIFLEDEDRKKFLYYLLRAREVAGFELYGYCLMNNHAHILMKESEELGQSIKRITVGYAQWHNNKYGRTGHLFQNRYKSEAVEDEKYLIGVARYIHQNPVKAKIVRKAEDYKWSSYKDYITSYDGKTTKIDTELIMSYFIAQDSFEDYMNKANEDKFLEYEVKIRYTDKDLKRTISDIIDIKSIGKLSKNERDEVICNIYQVTGASIRQLSKTMDLGRGIIEKAVKKR
jgi:putative transposase